MIEWNVDMLRILPLVTTGMFFTTALACSDNHDYAAPRIYSEIARDESVTFFRTAAWFDTNTQVWHLPIHGWVYEPQDSRIRKAAIAGILKETFDLQPEGEAEAIFASRVNWLIADSERDKVVYVRLGDRNYEMPSSGPDGHFESTIELPVEQIERIATDGQVRFSVETDEAETRIFSGIITLVPPEGVSVISDIDDTIKISHVTERAKLLEYALLREFQAVPGMAQTYAGWAGTGAAVHFVSSSPWQLYGPLALFAERAGFPMTSFHLKNVRFRDETLLDLFKKGAATKPAQIEPILQTWPDRTFVLVGDSGEQDPEVYADLMRRYPNQIRRIYIRNVTNSVASDARMDKVFEGIDANRWQLFTDPEMLELPPPER